MNSALIGHYKNIIKSLKEVHLEKKDMMSVYRANLKGRMTIREWKRRCGKYNTAEKISAFEKASPKSSGDIFNASVPYYRRMFSRWVLVNKVAINGNFAPTADEIIQYRKKIKKDSGEPTKLQKKQIAEVLRREKISKWWSSVLKKYPLQLPEKYEPSVLKKISKFSVLELDNKNMTDYLRQKYIKNREL
jgi:hypothetical protein